MVTDITEREATLLNDFISEINEIYLESDNLIPKFLQNATPLFLYK